ncbi:DNA cytosine methyltransferase [Mucilaginibacter terrae]|uniref:DNA cytosine methyltransferase n=1 Tax=Mucilaginibacter terrae TaxID=1955052 RepID=UPI00363D7237
MPNQPQIIDLYAGVGGLSLGATKANFQVAGAVEFEKRIIDSHAKNFPKTHHIHADVSKLTGKDLFRLSHLKSSSLAGLVGGPPCQGFSTMGKRNLLDERNNLFVDFFRLVIETMPAFYLAENVPGILNTQYDDIRKTAFSIVEGFYDVLEPLKIKASDYGAATIRTRVFFIGVRKDIKGSELIKDAIIGAKLDTSNFVNTAIAGLPVEISDNWDDYLSSWREIDVSQNNAYIQTLNRVIDNIGDDQAISTYLNQYKVSGSFGTKHSKEVALRYANLEQGQQDPISKSVKLKPDGYCPTLRAGTGSNKGSFQAVRPIHPTEARVITPREAARLQGFPDWFQFHETKWHSFRQIGNSVCPIAAEKVLSVIRETLKL